MDDYHAALVAIQNDERYQQNLDWGEPRSGHPEGAIRAHIADLERNLRQMRGSLTDEEIVKLRLLIHTHDTFKPDARAGAPIIHPRSHASLARAFLREFVADEDLLAMVQFHDEPYALWNQIRTRLACDQRRFEQLLLAIHNWRLFTAFLIIDGCTAGKTREPLQWFLGEIQGRVRAPFEPADIL
jgi:hypothetical protein